MGVLKNFFASIIYLVIFFTPLNADIFSIFPAAQQSESKELYLKYSEIPNIIYMNQRFSVKLEAIILTDANNYDLISTNFLNGNNIELITSDVIWKDEGNHKFTATIVYKVTSKNFRLPDIKLNIYEVDEYVLEDDILINSIKLKAPKIKFSDIINNQNNFSNIIATDMIIKDIQTKQFNNKMLMVVCNIETQNGNLEEFNIKQFQDQGINSFSENYPSQSMFYYLIIPSHINIIKFNYYNPILLEFTEVILPISLEENLVSTQTDLNPNNHGLLLYKQIASIVLLMISIILYIVTRHYLSIIFIVVFLIISSILLIPNKKIFIVKNTNVYILPTPLSTIYKVSNTDNEVEVLMEKDNFIKVLFKNKNIGWIRKSDVK